MSTQFSPLLLETLRRARRITLLTGAGVSAESGVPTFRDALTGLWERFQPEELATLKAFLADLCLVWEWYAWRRHQVRSVEPNLAHRAIELHGNIQRVKYFDGSIPVARMPREAKAHGAKIVAINPDAGTLGDTADFHIQGKTGEMLPALTRTTWGLQP